MSRLIPLLLALSVIANVVLAVLIGRDRDAAADLPLPATAAVAATPTARPVPTERWDQIFETADSATLRDRLADAGFPPDLVKAIVVRRERERNRPASVTHRSDDDKEDAYWLGRTPRSRAAIEAAMQATNDTEQTLRQIFGAGYDLSPADLAIAQRRYGPLSAEKIAQLQAIERDYLDLSMIYLTSLLRLPQDQLEIDLLEQEHRADLNDLLTPAELGEMLVRSGNSSSMLASRLDHFEPTEAEFRQLHAAWFASDSAFATTLLPSMGMNMEAQNELREELLAVARTTLSPERLADFEQATRPNAYGDNAFARHVGLSLDSARMLSDIREEVSQNSRSRPPAAGATDEAAAAAQAARTQALWMQLVETFGEAPLREFSNLPGGSWLKLIAPPPPEG